jgi:hypothetical protein
MKAVNPPELTKEEYVRLELIKALVEKLQWPPNEATKTALDYLTALVLYPEGKGK